MQRETTINWMLVLLDLIKKRKGKLRTDFDLYFFLPAQQLKFICSINPKNGM